MITHLGYKSTVSLPKDGSWNVYAVSHTINQHLFYLGHPIPLLPQRQPNSSAPTAAATLKQYYSVKECQHSRCGRHVTHNKCFVKDCNAKCKNGETHDNDTLVPIVESTILAAVKSWIKIPLYSGPAILIYLDYVWASSLFFSLCWNKSQPGKLPEV